MRRSASMYAHRGTRLLGYGASVLVAFGALVGCESLEIPEGPDLAALARRYDRPSGILDASNVAKTVEAAREIYANVGLVGRFEFAIREVESVSAEVTKFADTTRPVLVSLLGSAESKCPNYTKKKKAAGLLDFTLAVENSEVKPGVECLFRSCRLEDGPLPITLDGTLGIWLEGDLSLESLEFSGFVLEYEGTVANALVGTLPLAFDFRLLVDESVETRVANASGEVVFRFESEERAVARTRDGYHCCEFESRVCRPVRAASCRANPSPGEELHF